MRAMQYRVERNLQEKFSFFRKLPRNLVHQLDHVKISQINPIRANFMGGTIRRYTLAGTLQRSGARLIGPRRPGCCRFAAWRRRWRPRG